MKKLVSITDDHFVTRQGIKTLLEFSQKYEVVIEARHGQELLDMLDTIKINTDLAIIDVSMPIMDGFETVAEMTLQHPNIACIALSLHDDYVTVFKMIDAGAKAYILKDYTPEKILEIIDTVAQHGSCYDSFVMDKILIYNSIKTTPVVVEFIQTELSDRETEFIKLCCSELAYKEIADRMGVSIRTTDTYRDNIFEKTNCKSRVGMVLYAMEMGLYVPKKKK